MRSNWRTFLWVECKWIRNMWIKFLLNLKGNLNIKGKCFSNSFLASAKVRTLEKRVGDIYWIQMHPVFSSLVYKEHFDLWIKGSITKDLQVSYPIMLNLQSKISIFLEFIVFPCFFLFLLPFVSFNNSPIYWWIQWMTSPYWCNRKSLRLFM